MVETQKKPPQAAETDDDATVTAAPAVTAATAATNENVPETAEPFDSMTAVNGAAFEVFSQACQAYASGLTALNGEFMSFLSMRLQHDADLGRELTKCHSLVDITNLQQEWAQTASQAYFAEAGKLMDLASKVATESWEPLSEKADKAAAELRKAS